MKCKDCNKEVCICITKDKFIELTILWFKQYRKVDSKLLQVYATFYNKYWKTDKAAIFKDLSCDRCIWTAIRESMAKIVSEGLYCNNCNKQICECKEEVCNNCNKQICECKEEVIEKVIEEEFIVDIINNMKKVTVEDEAIENKGANIRGNSRKKAQTK